jgi:lipooligosaccharide transport system permease protein
MAQAMQTAAFESTYPVMAGIRWLKTYVAMILSPLDARHVASGQLLWAGLRVAFGAVIFALVMAVFGAIEPGRAVLLIPVAVLTGLAFAAPIQAFAATQRNDSAFASLFRFVIMPMFIFSGTFFPISQLPELLQVVAFLTPLWHAVALARGIALDVLDPALAAVNVAYLSAFVVVGLLWSYRAFAQKLTE